MNSSTSDRLVPSAAIALSTPSAGWDGVVEAFRKRTSPVRVSSSMASTKVPPMSTASRTGRSVMGGALSDQGGNLRHAPAGGPALAVRLKGLFLRPAGIGDERAAGREGTTGGRVRFVEVLDQHDVRGPGLAQTRRAAQPGSRVGMPGPVEALADRPFLDHPAEVEHDDPVGEAAHGGE